LKNDRRGHATRAGLLEKLGDLKLTKSEIQLLIGIAVDRDEDHSARQCAVRSLGKRGVAAQPAWISLLHLLQDDRDVRRDRHFFIAIVNALGNIEPPKEDRVLLVKSA